MATKTKAAPAANNPTVEPAEAPAATPKAPKGKGKVKADETPAPLETPPPAPQPVAESLIDQVPLSLLERAPENVRKTAPAEKVAELAEDIAAHGLLQSLIGYRTEPNTSAPVMICGGGRRLQALQLLLETERVGAEYTVPVLLRPQSEAVEISLAENLQRHDMNPADEFAAFELLLRDGTRSPADLAKRFGYTERHVKQRLRLAGLEPEILEALRNDAITLDAAFAYAGTRDRDLQAKVFKQHNKQGAWEAHKPSRIAADYTNAQANTGSRLFLYVGAEAYEAAGGQYEDDLFVSDKSYGGHRKLASGHILQTLAEQKASEEKALLLEAAKAKYPTVVDVLMSPNLGEIGTYSGQLPKAPKGSAAIKADYYSGVDQKKALSNAANAELPIHVVAHLAQDGTLTITESAFFVPKDKVEVAKPPRTQSNHVQITDEERAAMRRAEGIRILAAKKAINANSAAKVEGRRSWERDYLYNMTHAELGEGFYLIQRVFVTEAEIAAQMDYATADYDAHLARVEAEKRAKAEAAEQAEKALQDRRAAILAMDPAPAVVEVDSYATDGLTPLYRRDEFDGAYMEDRPGAEESDCVGYETLAELLDDADAIGRTWATIEAYDADVASAESEAGPVELEADNDAQSEAVA